MEPNCKIKVVTRYNNEELFQMMQSLIPVEVVKISGHDDYMGAATYLEHILELDCDIVVNVDLDCFIFDWEVVEEMIKFLIKYDLTHLGISDSKMIGRANISSSVMNPFFNVFNIKEIKKLQGFGQWEKIFNVGCIINFVNYATRHPFIEPFNGLFNWLHYEGSACFIDNRQHEDVVSVVPIFDGQEFAYHSWYSREFNYDDFHKQRIINLYNEAKLRHGK